MFNDSDPTYFDNFLPCRVFTIGNGNNYYIMDKKMMDFYDACEHGHLKQVTSLFKKDNIDIHNCHELALRLAVNSSSLETVKFLVEHGADVSYIELRVEKEVYGTDVYNYIQTQLLLKKLKEI